MLKCIIIDDEEFSIDAIMDCIELIPRLSVVAIYRNSMEALEKITSGSNVDLIFMDINMPHLSGIDLAKSIRFKTKRLVFTTAHSRYALEAYQADGEAFLLKPYTFAKFASVVNRLFPIEEKKTIPLEEQDEYFLIKSKGDDLKMKKIHFNEIVAFESELNYVKIHLTNGRSLTAYLTILDVLELVQSHSDFKQFHRAYVISTKYIKHIEKAHITMENELDFSVGRHFKNDFSAYLSTKLVKTSRGTKEEIENK